MTHPWVRLIQQWYKQHEEYAPASFFILGVLFDVFTLGRIDDLFNIIQQGLYLGIIAMLLNLELQNQVKPLNLSGRWQKVWHYREFITHFFFGSLLSVYTLFYFKSASLAASLIFFAFLTTLLVINEFERFQKMGLYVKYALYTLCLTSYFIYLMPIFFGSMGIVPTTAALIGSLLVIYGLVKMQLSKIGDQKLIMRQVVLPAVLVQLIFLGLNFLQLIPPVPLSVQYIGIYHQISKADDKFALQSLRPWWRFWHKSDELFAARPDDKIYCFARIFSPTKFKDKIYVRWSLKLPNGKWYPSDAIEVNITGGREEGFRGITYKANHQPGRWRVQLESQDHREIARLNFTVVADHSTTPRSFRTEYQ